MTDTLIVPTFTEVPPRHVRGRHTSPGLRLSHDRKVSPTGLWQASRNRWVPMTPNSFGLPAGSTCPDKTSFCRSCYAKRSENASGVAQLLRHNQSLLELPDPQLRVNLIAHMMWRYRCEAERKRLPVADRIFRIHWSGDFYSLDYANAWAAVIRATPDITYWAYTRSFMSVNVVPVLAGIPNLALYLSVDEENADAARLVTQEHPVRLALCATDYATARELLPNNAIPCPENTGRMELMAEGRGACVTCGICPTGRRDIMFSTSHREDVGVVPVQLRPTAPSSRQCANPACGAALPRSGGPGRPRLYCAGCRP